MRPFRIASLNNLTVLKLKKLMNTSINYRSNSAKDPHDPPNPAPPNSAPQR